MEPKAKHCRKLLGHVPGRKNYTQILSIFCPRMRPKTFLQFFALEQRKYKAKLCRNVLGRKNKIQNRSFRKSKMLPWIHVKNFILKTDRK